MFVRLVSFALFYDLFGRALVERQAVPSQSFRVARQRCNSEHLQSFKSQTAKGTHHLMDERARQLFPSMKRQLSEDAMLAAGLENSPETQTTYGSTSAA